MLLLVLEFFQKVIAEIEAKSALLVFQHAVKTLTTHCLTSFKNSALEPSKSEKKDVILNLTRARAAMVLVRTIIDHIGEHPSLVAITFDSDVLNFHVMMFR